MKTVRPQPALLSEFLGHIDVARLTESAYRYALYTFAEFLLGPAAGESEPALRTADVILLREDTLSTFRHWMRHDQKLSQRSEGLYLAAAIRYVEWLDVGGHLPAGVTAARMKLVLRNARGRRRAGYKTKPIKESVPLIIAYFDEQKLASADTPRARQQRLATLRNRAICHTLFATGMRALELTSLRRSDCADGAATKILITGKGQKERLVSLNPEAQAAIRKYLRARDEDRASRPTARAARDEPLFVRHNREGDKAISTKTLWQIINGAAKALGLPSSVGPHDFRHYIATAMLSEGMPLESVQDFLGHESIVTTRTVYAHTWGEVLDDQVKTFRPSPAQAQRRARKAKDD